MIYFIIIIISLLYSVIIIWLTEGIRNTSLKLSSLTEFPLVSVIIAVRNEENNINHLIDCLIQQSYPQDSYEIIIINDRSTDSTKNIISSYTHDHNNIISINIKNTPLGWAPKKWAIQSGIDFCKGELILQTDADCTPPSKWIEVMVNAFQDPSIGFVSGPSPLEGGHPLLSNLFELDSLSQDAFSAGGMSHDIAFSCTARNMAYRKKVFDEINGFDSISKFQSGDDDLLLQKIATLSPWKFLFIIDKEASISSPPPLSFQDFIHQRIRFASKGFDYYSLNTTSSLKIILPFLYITNICILYSLISFSSSVTLFWLFPWVIKSFADAWITITFYHSLDRKWTLSTFMVLSILHPIYVVIFGFLGPIKQFKWKT